MQPTTTPSAPWGMRRMAPLGNAEPSPWRYAGLDPQTQTGRWIGGDGSMTPAELGKHGTSAITAAGAGQLGLPLRRKESRQACRVRRPHRHPGAVAAGGEDEQAQNHEAADAGEAGGAEVDDLFGQHPG